MRDSQLRAVIVDDEPGAREILTDMLAVHPEISVVDTCEDATQAIASASSLQPDVMFLDVQMPGGTGFEVVRALQELQDERELPLVVFVTAYDAHAVRAFEAGALDYLLKPFDELRLHHTVRRVAAQAFLRGPASVARAEGLPDALEPLEEQLRPLRRLPMRVGDRIQLVPINAVAWFGADGKYIQVHLVDGAGHAVVFSLRRTMHSLERQLDSDQFLRVSRSAIVNIDHLRYAEAWSHGEYMLVLRDGSRVVTTAGFRHGIQRILRGG